MFLQKFLNFKNIIHNYINLSKIETRPSRDIANSHDFFIDCEGHQLDSKLKTVIKKIKDSGASVRLLGSYPDFI